MPRGVFSRVWAVGLAWAAAACLPDGQLKIPYNDEPHERDDGWSIQSPEAAGIDPVALRAAYRRFFSEDEFVSARSLLVVRHGQLVAEGYCRAGADRELIASLQSATKSVTSLLLGIARDADLLADLDQPVCEVLASACEKYPNKRKVTLRHLLTMRSGIDFPNEDFALDMEHGGHKDSAERVLAQPLARKPGEHFHYQDSDVHLLGAAIAEATGRSLSEFAQAHLFAPLGITDSLWLSHADGRNYGAFGLYLRPRDFAKLGLLALDRGSFHGERIVSEAWIEQSTQLQAESSGKPHENGFDYGYYWWVSEQHGAFSADGHGGQLAWVQPELDLLIVLTADWDTAYNVGPAITLWEFASLATQIADAISGP